MWRAKNTTLKTTNLCNQFLIIYLSKKKAFCDKIGNEKKGYVYNTAITSIKKYPLPIISVKQLKLLHGLGDLLCQQLISVIKSHYSDYLKKKNNRQIEMNNEKPQPRSQVQLAQEQQYSINKANSVSLNRLMPYNKYNHSQEIDDDSQSKYSVKSAVYNKTYKPRPNTQASYIMIILKKNRQQRYLSIENIKDRLKIDYNQNISKKMLILAINNLIKSQYLIYDSLDNNFVQLTQKGLIQCDLLEVKNKAKQSQLKVKSLISSFLSNTSNIVIQKKQHKRNKRIVQYGQDKQLILLIDNRQIKNKQETNFFQLKLKQKYGIKCLNRNLPLGDFLWMYDGYILDYIVQRKTADDLVSSILDGRYHQQKFRLKNSQFTNIYYLYEGHLTGQFAKNERQASSALLNTRIQDKFKVIQVYSINQSIKFIHFLTETLFTKLRKQRRLQAHGTFQQFQMSCGKNSNMSVEQIFGLSLKTIPGVGQSTVQILLKYFKSFRSLHKELNRLQSEVDRIQFLKQLFKGCGISKNIPELLVKLLF